MNALTPASDRVHMELRTNGTASLARLARQTGLTGSAVRNGLKTLIRENKVRRVSVETDTLYSAVDR